MVNNKNGTGTQWLFWTCFIALVATSFGFIVRAQIIGDLGAEFGLSETQKGEILGVGLWPFAISIILFSLVIDKIGYGTSLWFAFLCHVVSVFVTIFAKGYNMLYIGTFILALGNGTVEAVINPAVATIYSKEKTKWLNILHAGWPGGLFLGGVLALFLGKSVSWQWKVALLLIPAVVYGIMLIRCHFPVHERVKTGVSYRDMLKEAGIIIAIIAVVLIVLEVGRVFEWSLTIQLIIAAVLILAYGIYVRSIGRPLIIFLVLIMIPLAITELGTDSWITELVKPVLGDNAGWVLVYTALIMMILRFSAGPIVERLSPLGLLAVCSTIAIVGLIFLSKATGILVFVAATVYGIGKTFFWPTMLGVVAEQSPKGGALTINAISGIGMLAVGIIGAPFFGNIVDKPIERELKENHPAIHQQVIVEERTSIFGDYKPVDKIKAQQLDPAAQKTLNEITSTAQKDALFTVAIFPVIMLICYLILIFYFRAKGGYKPVELGVQQV